MLRRFLRDSALYSISAALSRGIAIVLIPLYTRFLQPAEYGALDLLMVAATILNYLISLEISQGVARVYAEAKTPEARQSCVSSAVWFAIAAYATFVLLATQYPSEIARLLLGSTTWTAAVQAMIVAVAANGVFFLLQDLLRWQLQPLRHAVASITYTAVSASVGAVLVIYADSGVQGILHGQSAGAMAGLAVACYNGAARDWALRFDTARWREMASYSAPQVISSVAAFFTLYVDRLLIQEFMTLDDVGIYGVGARIASVVALLMAGFQSGYIPIVFQNYQSPETPGQMARVFRYFLAMAIGLLLLLAGFSRELLWIFTTPHYYGSWQIIPLLAAAQLFANMYIFAPGIFIARRTGLVAAINIATALLNVGLNLMLIPAMGIFGAALGTLCSGITAFLAHAYFNRRFYPIPFEWSRITLAVMLGFSLAATLMLLQQSSGGAALAGRILLCLAGGLLALAILLGREEISRLAAKTGFRLFS